MGVVDPCRYFTHARDGWSAINFARLRLMIIKLNSCICIVRIVMSGVTVSMLHAWSAGKYNMECQ